MLPITQTVRIVPPALVLALNDHTLHLASCMTVRSPRLRVQLCTVLAGPARGISKDCVCKRSDRYQQDYVASGHTWPHHL